MLMEKLAAEQLTPYAFRQLQEQLVLSSDYAVYPRGNESVISHRLHPDRKRLIGGGPEKPACSCKAFEYVGIPCRHILKYLNVNNFFEIPK